MSRTIIKKVPVEFDSLVKQFKVENKLKHDTDAMRQMCGLINRGREYDNSQRNLLLHINEWFVRGRRRGR